MGVDEAEYLHQLPSWNACDNSLEFQAFERHVPADRAHWRRLRRALPKLKAMGIDNIWIRPGCKGANPTGNGYFDQKGSQSTKGGTKEELRLPAIKVNPKNRMIEISEPEEIERWVGFNFPGRDTLYSSLKYNWSHFSSVDWGESRKEEAIFKIKGPNKGWATDVSNENGNYDYLMFSDLHYSNPEVQRDVVRWGHWVTTQLPLSGMRLDAAKHYPADFQKTFIKIDMLLDYLDKMENQLSLFDVPLLGQFSRISLTKGADMRRIFEGTLVQQKPEHAVTFVANNDTAPIAPYFKPIAYALILLRDKGQPCVFYGDLYGIRANSNPSSMPAYASKLATLIQARQLYANGAQRDYFDRPNCIGFVRYGNARHPFGLACIMSNSVSSQKRMHVGRAHSGEQWTDILNSRTETIKINRRGYGVFPVSALSVSGWVNFAPESRENLHLFL
ncbi:glycoside hydrolase superfamily [Aspergillus heterothallicus]